MSRSKSGRTQARASRTRGRRERTLQSRKLVARSHGPSRRRGPSRLPSRRRNGVARAPMLGNSRRRSGVARAPKPMLGCSSPTRKRRTRSRKLQKKHAKATYSTTRRRRVGRRHLPMLRKRSARAIFSFLAGEKKTLVGKSRCRVASGVAKVAEVDHRSSENLLRAARSRMA